MVDLLQSGSRVEEGQDLKIEKRYEFPSGAYESEEEPQHQKQRLILTPYREYPDGSSAENGGDEHKRQPQRESRSDVDHTKGPPLWTIKSAYPVEREER